MGFRLSRSGMMPTFAFCLFVFSATAHAYTPEQQQACTGDAFRLCGNAIPDVDRVTVCMIRNRALLSPGCRVYFRSPEPAAAPVRMARRPVRITPAAMRHQATVRPKKPKKPARAAGAT
jgi:hypothetical protein